MPLKTMIEMLRQILSADVKRRPELIEAFQDLVWHGENVFRNEFVESVIIDLAYDIDFYEPNEILRREDVSYFGDQRLDSELMMAIQKLEGFLRDESAPA